MKRIVLAAAVVTALFLPGADARAGSIGSTASNNDVIGVMEGWFGANLYLTGPADIYIEFLGVEAGYTNTFTFNGDPKYTETGLQQDFPAGTGGVTVNGVSAGLLNFSFSTNQSTSVSNGANVLPSANAPNFFITFGHDGDAVVDGVTPSGGQSVILAFDDNGSPDDNHDDLVVRLSVTSGGFSVPDGGTTVALLGFALMGLGVLRRRFGA